MISLASIAILISPLKSDFILERTIKMDSNWRVSCCKEIFLPMKSKVVLEKLESLTIDKLGIRDQY